MSRQSEKAFAPLIAGFLVLTPQLAEACSVCGAGRDEANRVAFIVTTAFMSILPLLIIGGLIMWLRARFRALEDVQQSTNPDIGTDLSADLHRFPSGVARGLNDPG